MRVSKESGIAEHMLAGGAASVSGICGKASQAMVGGMLAVGIH